MDSPSSPPQAKRPGFGAGLSLALLVALYLLAAQPAAAKFFKYVDKNGVTVFVDDETRIPAEYRQGTTVYREPLDHLSPEERAVVRERQRQERETEAELYRLQKEEAARDRYLQSLQTRVVILGNQVLVPVRVGYGRKKVEVNLLLDTGASHTVFYRNAVENLAIDRMAKTLSRLAGGHVIRSDQVEFSVIEVGPFERRRVKALVIDNVDPDSPMDGLLGMDFLKYRPYTIDYQNELILWEPQDQP